MAELLTNRSRKFLAWILLASTIATVIPIGLAFFNKHIAYKDFTQDQLIYKKEQQTIQKNQICLSLWLLLFASLLCLTIGMFIIKPEDYWWWWIVSAIISAFSFTEMLYIWELVYKRGYTYSKDYIPFENKTDFDQLKESIKQESTNPFVTIPTGIYLEHLFFARKDNDIYPGVMFNGIVWQRYKNIPDTITRGIVFPDACQYIMEKLFHEKINENEELIGWQFSIISMFQRFDLAQYPFDHRHVKIHLLHPNFEKNVILVPDFESYTNAKSYIGLSKFFTIPHWTLEKTFFSSVIQNWGTTFGSKTLNATAFPQLYYFVMVHRNFWGSAAMYLILLLVAAIILFVALLAFLKQERLTGLLGFSTIGTLGICSSLLFVLISTHIEMRSSIAIEGTAYLEYLYAIFYLMTLIVALNSILFALHEKIRLIQFKDNFIIKLLYWPVLINAMLLVTVLTFY